MRRVSDILEDKGRSVFYVSADTTVYDALKLMDEKNIGAVLVMDGDSPLGILSERDYARKVALRGKHTIDTPASEIMTERIICVSPAETVDQCMALMTDKRIRHLPVLEDEKLVGVISIGDVVKATIAEKEFLIEQLEHYIRGTPYVKSGLSNTP